MLDESLGVHQSQCLTMIDLKNQIVHIRDSNIWWKQDYDPQRLIQKAGGTIAEPDEGNETITIYSFWPQYRKPPADESFINENLFWPECIKQAFPDYLQHCDNEYYVVGDIIYYSKEDVMQDVEGMLDDSDSINIEICDASLVNNPVVCYTYNNEDSLSTEGNFYAFECQEHLDLFEQQLSYTAHQIFFQIQ